MTELTDPVTFQWCMLCHLISASFTWCYHKWWWPVDQKHVHAKCIVSVSMCFIETIIKFYCDFLIDFETSREKEAKFEPSSDSTEEHHHQAGKEIRPATSAQTIFGIVLLFYCLICHSFRVFLWHNSCGWLCQQFRLFCMYIPHPFHLCFLPFFVFYLFSYISWGRLDFQTAWALNTSWCTLLILVIVSCIY